MWSIFVIHLLCRQYNIHIVGAWNARAPCSVSVCSENCTLICNLLMKNILLRDVFAMLHTHRLSNCLRCDGCNAMHPISEITQIWKYAQNQSVPMPVGCRSVCGTPLMVKAVYCTHKPTRAVVSHSILLNHEIRISWCTPPTPLPWNKIPVAIHIDQYKRTHNKL